MCSKINIECVCVVRLDNFRHIKQNGMKCTDITKPSIANQKMSSNPLYFFILLVISVNKHKQSIGESA